MSSCLLCYQAIDPDEGEMHASCIRRLFHSDVDVELPFGLADFDRLLSSHVKDRVAVTGVQKKLSLHLVGEHGSSKRLTLLGFRGDYILKPPTEEYPELPELEDVTMHMAERCGITVVPHGLVRLQSGELSYITRRVDRTGDGGKVHMEDFCQLSGQLTEHKYRGSVERVGKLLYQFSAVPGLDRINYFTLLVFCFLTGNADMHLKNFSLISTADGYRLAPAYDLLPTVLLIPEDEEESALTINGKKNRLGRSNFLRAAETMEIPHAAATKSIEAMLSDIPACLDVLQRSFVSDERKDAYASLLQSRAERLG